MEVIRLRKGIKLPQYNSVHGIADHHKDKSFKSEKFVGNVFKCTTEGKKAILRLRCRIMYKQCT
jgi:hypothetical protein